MVMLWRACACLSLDQACASFDPTIYISNSTIRLRQYIHANTSITLQGMEQSCNRTKQVIPINSCRIALTVPTTNRSSFIMELFLPDEAVWAGRLLSVGNGGIDGCIKYEDIAYGLDLGFAVTGTNNGHNGTGGEAFLGNPDIIEDFSWRALHVATTGAKTLLNAFYGKKIDWSYYLGCSGGGRQGIQAARMFPDDYDGILVGAPALNFNYMSAWRARFYTLTGASDSSTFIATETWKGLIHDEVLKQCDDLDGVQDGILADPNLCAATFRPEALLCNATESLGCLTAHQVEVVRQVFSPLYGVAGDLIYPPLAPGAEAQATDRLLSGTAFNYSVDWYRYAVYSEPSWDPASWTVGDIAPAEQANPGNARTWPNDLSQLRDRKSKMIVYHGGADQQITGFDTERWYNYLSTQMSATSEELDGFLRFFRIPGMGHCNGGVGAWQFGQNAAAAKGVTLDRHNNILSALLGWVEEGHPPETIRGLRFHDDNYTQGIALKRPHCRYPQRSTYIQRDMYENGTWECV